MMTPNKNRSNSGTQPQPGDRVRIIAQGRTEEGLFMPSPDAHIVFIKLNTGYNLGFERKDITSLEMMDQQSPSTEAKSHQTNVKKTSYSKKTDLPTKTNLPAKANLPTIVVLHTGGTIASKVDYRTGGVTAAFTADDLLEMFPELHDTANIHTDVISNVMSEDIMFADYQTIAQAIKKYADEGVEGREIKGIIVAHGTDTLSYTAAALSFMFEKINLPVLLVGSQRSPDRGSSDAGLNLLCAAKFIVETDFSGLAVCMHHSSHDDECVILPGTKVRKMHTSRRDAFKAVNISPIALVNLNHIEFLEKKNNPSDGQDAKLQEIKSPELKPKIILKDKFEEKVGLLKVHPQMSSSLFKHFTDNYKAFVIEGTGMGHAPTNLGENNLQNYAYLKSFLAKGGIVAITSQCLFGRVHPYVYTNLRRLSEIGCIFCEDMLPETAFIKLAWLLGNYPPEEAKRLMAQNLRGEISLHSTYSDHFLS